MSATSNTAPDQPKIGRAVLTPAIAARLEELRTCEELSKTKMVISSKPFALLIAQLAYEGNGARNVHTGSSGWENRDDFMMQWRFREFG